MAGSFYEYVYIPPKNGIVGGYTGDNINIIRAMIAFSAIAWYNCIELIFLICIRFKKWKGLYFWSLMVTSWAIIVYQIGSWGKMNNIVQGNISVMTAFTNAGWIVMITGESLVLYSRLHLLSQNHILLRCVFWIIIINSFCMYIPTTVLDVGANVLHRDNPNFASGYTVMERIQMTSFSVQEIAISSIYLIESYRFLKDTYAGDRGSRNIMYELVVVNVIIIMLDVALLAVSFKGLFEIEVTLKGLVYSTKLKLELGVLSRLVKIASGGDSGLQRTATFENDLAQITSNEQKAFGGLDFCTTPFSFEKVEKIPSMAHRDSSSDSASIVKEPFTEPKKTKRQKSTAVPWLTTTTRAKSVESPTFCGRLKSVSKSPLSSPLIQRPSLHAVQREDSYANTEFLTSAAVIEGANDDNIRQFQKEIDEELGRAPPMPGFQRAVSTRDESTLPTVHLTTTKSNETSKKEDAAFDDDEEQWARGLGVLGPPVRPMHERGDSLDMLYPGRITGEHG